jgi:hypothetical protein
MYGKVDDNATSCEDQLATAYQIKARAFCRKSFVHQDDSTKLNITLDPIKE